MSATDSADKESLIYKTFSSHLLQTPQSDIDCLPLFCEWYIFVVLVMRRTKHNYMTVLLVHPNTPCSHSGGGVEFCHDYGLVFFISVHVHLLLASGEKKSPFL